MRIFARLDVYVNPDGPVLFQPLGFLRYLSPSTILQFVHSFFDQLFRVIIYGGIIQGVFVVLLLNNKAARKGRANLFLSILLIALSFSTAHLLFAAAVIDHLSAEVYSLGDPTFLLIAPLLWFYARELTGKRVAASWRLVLHFIPFLAVITLSVTARNIESESFRIFLNHVHHMGVIVFWIIVVVQFSCYQILIHRRLSLYHHFIQEEVSSIENVSVEWVRFFMGIFLIINIFFLFGLFAVIHLEPVWWLSKATALLFSISIFALGYKGILQKEIFQRNDTTALPTVETSSSATSSRSKPDQALLDQLQTYMVEKKPYLDADLTLSDLAKNLNISRTQLSSLINEGTGDNFYDFINKFRVDEVKRLMVDPEVKNFNMLGLALEAGFKSKSTFNLIFKRFTGLTPTAYRKNISP